MSDREIKPSKEYKDVLGIGVAAKAVIAFLQSGLNFFGKILNKLPFEKLTSKQVLFLVSLLIFNAAGVLLRSMFTTATFVMFLIFDAAIIILIMILSHIKE